MPPYEAGSRGKIRPIGSSKATGGKIVTEKTRGWLARTTAGKDADNSKRNKRSRGFARKGRGGAYRKKSGLASKTPTLDGHLRGGKGRRSKALGRGTNVTSR